MSKNKNKLARKGSGSNSISFSHHHQQTQINIWPIPPAAELARYNEIFPNAAERLITRWEEQGTHRMVLEKKVIGAGIIQAYMGIVTGAVLCLAGIAAGTFLAYHGKDISGLGTIVTSLVALAGVFVYGKKKQESELADKRQALKK